MKKDDLLPLIADLTHRYKFAEVIPISARKRDGLDLLLRKIVSVLPDGQRYYPQDQYTDQPLRFMVAELIRESILIETGEEFPYAAAVVIEQFEEPEPHRRREKKAGPFARRWPASPPPFIASVTARRPSSSARAAPSCATSAPARDARSNRCWARASTLSCMSSSSPAGAIRRALSSRSTGAISSKNSPAATPTMPPPAMKNDSKDSPPRSPGLINRPLQCAGLHTRDRRVGGAFALFYILFIDSA